MNHAHLVAAVIFAAAAIWFFGQGKLWAVYVCVVAGAAYMAHLYWQEKISLRYIDWALTTPVIVYIIMSIDGGYSTGVKLAVAAADLGMVVCGWLGSIYGMAGNKYQLFYWFAAGCVFFLPVFWVLVEITRRSKKHWAVAALTLSIWLMYPVVYLLEALGLYNVELVIIVLDLLAKIGVGTLPYIPLFDP